MSSLRDGFGADGAERRLIRRVRRDETSTILAIVNDAAQKYHGAIPADCWHDPYMTAAALETELAQGVIFTGYEVDGELVGVMGLQPVANVRLIRHAYVVSRHQGRGVGGALIRHLCGQTSSKFLVGTWAAAIWATAFYERHGFRFVSDDAKGLLLDTYWNIPARQASVSVVLANPPLSSAQVVDLARAAAGATSKGGAVSSP
jgi:GNAT superfamily N-acetyltransferase